MEKKTAVITGASRGIGLELAKQLSEKGYEVYGFCRKKAPHTDSVKGVTIIEGVDVTYKTALNNGFSFVPGNIDLLINNAGVLGRETCDKFDKSAFGRIEEQFLVNAVGPLRVFKAARKKLKKGSKIVMITSRMGSIGDNDSGAAYGYRMSKAALNSAARSLAIDLSREGIPVGIFHPGWVKTDMTHYTGKLEPSESVAMLMDRIEDLDMRNSGQFFHANGEELPW